MRYIGRVPATYSLFRPIVQKRPNPSYCSRGQSLEASHVLGGKSCIRKSGGWYRKLSLDESRNSSLNLNHSWIWSKSHARPCILKDMDWSILMGADICI